MYFVQPSEGERYFLRLLVHHVPGATSFEDLACTNRHLQHPTQHAFFKEACQQRGLLQDDVEWAQCMEEAASMASASGHYLLPRWCSMLLQTHWLCGSVSKRTWQETSYIKHARLVPTSARVWLCMSACLAGLHVVRRSMLTMLCVCSYNV
jgi:hypothetical protein